MTKSFDSYEAWLGIASGERPVSLYRLLDVREGETDLAVIADAADRRMAFVKQLAIGPHQRESQRMLNELSAARGCLLNPSRKADYDAGLAAKKRGGPPPLTRRADRARHSASAATAETPSIAGIDSLAMDSLSVEDVTSEAPAQATHDGAAQVGPVAATQISVADTQNSVAATQISVAAAQISIAASRGRRAFVAVAAALLIGGFALRGSRDDAQHQPDKLQLANRSHTAPQPARPRKAQASSKTLADAKASANQPTVATSAALPGAAPPSAAPPSAAAPLFDLAPASSPNPANPSPPAPAVRDSANPIATPTTGDAAEPPIATTASSAPAAASEPPIEPVPASEPVPAAEPEPITRASFARQQWTITLPSGAELHSSDLDIPELARKKFAQPEAELYPWKDAQKTLSGLFQYKHFERDKAFRLDGLGVSMYLASVPRDFAHYDEGKREGDFLIFSDDGEPVLAGVYHRDVVDGPLWYCTDGVPLVVQTRHGSAITDEFLIAVDEAKRALTPIAKADLGPEQLSTYTRATGTITELLLRQDREHHDRTIAFRKWVRDDQERLRRERAIALGPIKRRETIERIYERDTQNQAEFDAYINQMRRLGR